MIPKGGSRVCFISNSNFFFSLANVASSLSSMVSIHIDHVRPYSSSFMPQSLIKKP